MHRFCGTQVYVLGGSVFRAGSSSAELCQWRHLALCAGTVTQDRAAKASLDQFFVSAPASMSAPQEVRARQKRMNVLSFVWKMDGAHPSLQISGDKKLFIVDEYNLCIDADFEPSSKKRFRSPPTLIGWGEQDANQP